MNPTPEIPAELLAEMTPAVRAFVESLLASMELQRVRMQAEIDELKAQVKRLTPQNSSIPPSTQHPHARATPKPKSKSKKKRGGQPGHKRIVRELVPIERCEEVIPLLPENCRRCGEDLDGTDPEPIRHQVWELPKIEPMIREYQRHRRTCRRCGTSTCAALPAGVPSGQFGPKLLAFTGLLMGHFRQSKRRAALFLSDLLNMPCCPAATVKMQNRVSQALEQPYEDLRALLANEKQLNMDESPTKQANQKAWLWTAVSPRFAVFAIFASRAATALPKLLGDQFKGIINCDRAKMYWQAERLQWCWAHLKRDFQSLIDHRDHQVKRLGHDLMRPVDHLFLIWHKYKSGSLSWKTFQTQVRPLCEKVNSLLLRGVSSGNKRLVGTCRESSNHRKWLWTFTEVEGIEPTNNVAERALRPAVIYRKLSFGTQSEKGSRFIERMLTVSETCRLQKRSVYQWLTQAVEASLSGQQAPSLFDKH
ncbi:IS66 family transposase [Schlesneria sp.]|uniref:IS66 family transposase n=1 Tax=Schlesneria sp. TaxID=2762018 RepID=UPI002EFDB3F0